MTINYTTKAEYYLQEGKQITLIPSVEGKNTLLIKNKGSIQQGGAAQHMGKSPLHLQDSMSAFASIAALCFADGNPFAFFFSCKIHLEAVF